MTELVYFVQARTSRYIKIGHTRGFARRLQVLRTASAEPLDLIGIIIGDRLFEKELHREFKQDRLGGEWFRETPMLLARIASLLAERGVPNLAEPPTPESQDEFTERAASWLEYLERREAQRHGIAEISRCRGDVAQRIGIAPGTIENLRRGRIVRISVTAYEAIRAALIEEKQREVAELRALADEIEAARRTDVDVAAARAALASAEKLLARTNDQRK